MAEYVFPAVFHGNEDGSYTITFPDLPGCISEGKSIGNAIYMAQDALKQWLEYLTDKGFSVPTASELAAVVTSDDEFVSYIRVDLKDKRAVRRTVSLPRWMDDRASAEGLSLSRVLQESLALRFQE